MLSSDNTLSITVVGQVVTTGEMPPAKVFSKIFEEMCPKKCAIF